MAAGMYKLTYYAELAQADGGLVRVEFYTKYDKSAKVTPKEIVDVIQGLALEVQGQSEDIDAPIVKTSLTMSVVDAPERNTDKVKCGDWEQFYTPDATGWKVVLLGKSKGEDEYRTLWGGYVTPDSFVETLCYHGVVSITARDNIGLLQEMEFDGVGNADDMITPYELVTQAWAKIASPMVLDWRGEEDENIWLQTEGVDIINTYLNLSAFKDMTWYDAVYNVLFSMGLTLRYVGNNKFAVASLRRLPYQSKAALENLPSLSPTFSAYGTRELIPAIKEIEDTVSYDLADGKEVILLSETDYQEDVSNKVQVTLYGALSQTTASADVMPLQNDGDIGWGSLGSGSIFFDPKRYFLAAQSIKKQIDEQMFMVVNSVDRTSWYGFQLNRLRPVAIKIEQGEYIQHDIRGITYTWTTFPEERFKIKAAIKLTQGTTEYWWNSEKSWTEEYKEEVYEFDEEGILNVPISFGRLTGSGIVQFFFIAVQIKDWTTYPTYLGVKSMSIVPDSQVLMTEQNTVRTVYKESNNMRVVRDSMFGPAYDEVALSAFIKNGIFRKDGDVYVPTPDWKWFEDDDTETLQLSAHIHRQLLCYHSKPNNLLSGTILGTDLTQPAIMWKWHNKEHMMVSGKYNFCNGRIENAQLREFARYENLW